MDKDGIAHLYHSFIKRNKIGSFVVMWIWASQMANGKEPACQFRRLKTHRFDPCIGKIPWRRAWQPTPAFLSGESNGKKRLMGGRELDIIEVTWVMYRSEVDCFRGRGAGCSRPGYGICPLGGGHH